MRLEESHPLLSDSDARNALFKRIEETTIQTEEKKIRTSKEEIYSQLLLIEAVDFEAFKAVSELLEATLFKQENGPLRYDQPYQFIAELQGRSLI